MSAGKSRRYSEVIAALLVERTIEDAARSCNLSKRTVLRWMQRDDFKTAYREARDTLLKEATGRLRAKSLEAADVLSEVAANKDNPPASRVRASLGIIKLALLSHEMENLEERIRKLEEQSDVEQPEKARVEP